MNLKDCEIRELYVRGMAADVIFGRHAVTDQEGAALLAEFLQIRPAARFVAYLSRDGWQLLAKAAEPAEPQPDAADAAASDAKPAVEPTAEPAPRPGGRRKKGAQA